MEKILDSEIFETKEILVKFFSNAKFNDLINLNDDPILTLKQLGISILNRIDNSRLDQLSRSIKSFLGNFIEKTKQGFKKYSNCLACKTALRILLFGFAASIGIAITAINTHFDGITDLLSKFFEQSISSIELALRNNGFQIGAFSLFDLNDLIESLCEQYGWC